MPFASNQLLSSRDLKKSRGAKRISTNKYSIRLKKSFIFINYFSKNNKYSSYATRKMIKNSF
jgi:hypothetical protein